MSRARNRARKRAFDKLSWAEKRHIINMAENEAIRSDDTPRPKPQWVLDVESSGYQTIGGTRRSSRVSGLTRSERQNNRTDRQARPAHPNPHTGYVRQVREDGRSNLMDGTPSKLLTLPVGTVLRSSLLPEFRAARREPSLYTR